MSTLFWGMKNQRDIISGIIGKYFEVNIQTILLYFSTDDRIQVISEQLKNMGIELAWLIGVQFFLAILGLILIGYFFVKLIGYFPMSEKILIIGYLFLVFSSVIILFNMGIEIYQKYNVIVQRVDRISVNEVEKISEQFKNTISDTTISMDNLVSDIVSLFEKIRSIIQNTKSIAGIPDLLTQTWEHLLHLKNWLVGCIEGAIGIILFGHGIAGVQLLRNSDYMKKIASNRKKSRQIELNEQLVSVIKQQNELINLLSEKSREE